MKSCTNPKCEQQNPQPLISYYKDKSQSSGLSCWCKSCKKKYHNKQAKEWAKKNKEKVKEYARIRNLKKYNLTIESYDAMLASQNNQCRICKVNQSTQKTRFAVDHCHTTGKVRGLLCRICNHKIVGWIEQRVGHSTVPVSVKELLSNLNDYLSD